MTTPSIEQVWIGNRRAKQNRIQNGNSKMYPKCRKYSRGPTAYSLFASGQPKGDMDGGDYLKKLGEQWKSLDPASVKKFQTESKELRCTLLKGRSRSEVISQEIKAIQNSIMTLAEVGFAIGGFGTDPEDILNSKNDICFVTSKAESFFNKEMFDKFKDYICKSDIKTTSSTAITCPPTNSEKKKKLQKQLREHFRHCWENSTGIKTAVPYKAIINGAHKVIGLATELVFKEPHLYSNGAMEAILKLSITFHPGNATETGNVKEHGEILEAELPEKEIEVPETLGEIIAAELPENEIKVLESTDLDNLLQQVSKRGVLETGMRKKRKAPKRKYTTKKKMVQENKLYEVEEIIEKKKRTSLC